jgi:hypothetical protein
MNPMEGGLNCALPAIYGMSVQTSGPHFLHLSFGSFSSLTPGSKFRNATKKLTLSFDNTQGLYHELRQFTDFLLRKHFSRVFFDRSDWPPGSWGCEMGKFP